MNLHNIDVDAFSSSQVQSKIWLANKLEKAVKEQLNRPYYTIWILAGWYGLTNFILRSRENINIREVRSFDIDSSCEPIADKINNLWEWQGWQFKSHTKDINELDYTLPPDIVINTSVEHMIGKQWFDRIPKGQLVCLQASDLNHDDHISEFDSEDKLLKEYPLRVVWQGTKRFQYSDNNGFNRYMIIGFK
jgi:hypothetical protein